MVPAEERINTVAVQGVSIGKVDVQRLHWAQQPRNPQQHSLRLALVYSFRLFSKKLTSSARSKSHQDCRVGGASSRHSVGDSKLIVQRF